MKASELIIGSMYNSVKFNTPVKLELSDMVELHNRCDGSELTSDIIFEMFEPIPLTESWIYKTGLIRNGLNTYKVHNGFYIEMERNLIMIGAYVVSMCKYVHQLQNLYFALTGEELTIK